MLHAQAPASALAMVRGSDAQQMGHGNADSHHGEIFQGVAERHGLLQRGLVSLPCGFRRSLATFYPTKYSSITVTPSWKFKARRAVELTLAYVRDLNLESP